MAKEVRSRSSAFFETELLDLDYDVPVYGKLDDTEETGGDRVSIRFSKLYKATNNKNNWRLELSMFGTAMRMKSQVSIY